MSYEAWIACATLVAAVVLFVSKWIPLAATALGIPIVLAATNTLTPEQSLSGFGNRAVIALASILLLGAGLQVVGISPQSADSHRKFSEQYSLPFTLLSDEAKTVIQAYGVDGPLGIGVRRATFLIDAKQKVLDAVLADLRIGRHREFVEAAIAARGGKA